MEFKKVIVDGKEIEIAVKVDPEYFENYMDDDSELEETKKIPIITEEEGE